MASIRDIRGFARAISEQYQPKRIILFGSHARRRPGRSSDVDFLVVMNYRGHPVRKAVEMLRLLRPPVAVDLIVRTPNEVARRLRWNDWFMHDVVNEGIVLYEAGHE